MKDTELDTMEIAITHADYDDASGSGSVSVATPLEIATTTTTTTTTHAEDDAGSAEFQRELRVVIPKIITPKKPRPKRIYIKGTANLIMTAWRISRKKRSKIASKTRWGPRIPDEITKKPPKIFEV